MSLLNDVQRLYDEHRMRSGPRTRSDLLYIDRGIRSPERKRLQPLSREVVRRVLSPVRPQQHTTPPSSPSPPPAASQRQHTAPTAVKADVFGDHLKRNLGLASLRVTIATETRKDLEGALRSWARVVQRRRRRQLKGIWMRQTSAALYRWQRLQRGMAGWHALARCVRRRQQREQLRRLQLFDALAAWRQFDEGRRKAEWLAARHKAGTSCAWLRPGQALLSINPGRPLAGFHGDNDATMALHDSVVWHAASSSASHTGSSPPPPVHWPSCARMVGAAQAAVKRWSCAPPGASCKSCRCAYRAPRPRACGLLRTPRRHHGRPRCRCHLPCRHRHPRHPRLRRCPRLRPRRPHRPRRRPHCAASWQRTRGRVSIWPWRSCC